MPNETICRRWGAVGWGAVVGDDELSGLAHPALRGARRDGREQTGAAAGATFAVRDRIVTFHKRYRSLG